MCDMGKNRKGIYSLSSVLNIFKHKLSLSVKCHISYFRIEDSDSEK